MPSELYVDGRRRRLSGFMRYSFDCAECGERTSNLRREARFCSTRCRRRAERQRLDAAHAKLTACEHCGVEFMGVRTGSGQQRYCSTGCSLQASAITRRTWVCITPGCSAYPTHGAHRVDGGRCAPCQAAVEAERERKRREPKERKRIWFAGNCIQCGEPFVFNQPHNRTCSSRCCARYHADLRKYRKRAATVEEVWRPKVYERDGWCCRLCGEPVEREAVAPHPLAPTIDHIVPLALGGEHSYANVQLAHFRCNWQKGTTMPDAVQMVLAG